MPRSANATEERVAPVVPRRVQRLAWVLAACVAGVVIAGAPARQWWTQRGQVESAQAELDRLNEDNAVLEARLERMRDPGEVERIARSELGMVREGEESYVMLPPPTAGLLLPDAWPFDRLAPALLDDSGEVPGP
jgi:cell division protein FtsB